MTETEEPPIMPPEIAQAQADAFLKVSSPESREIVLLALLKELIELNTDMGYLFLETAAIPMIEVGFQGRNRSMRRHSHTKLS